jgi:hypothetical protein
MMTLVTILFFAGTLGAGIFLNSYLDKREERRSGK